MHFLSLKVFNTALRRVCNVLNEVQYLPVVRCRGPTDRQSVFRYSARSANGQVVSSQCNFEMAPALLGKFVLFALIALFLSRVLRSTSKLLDAQVGVSMFKEGDGTILHPSVTACLRRPRPRLAYPNYKDLPREPPKLPDILISVAHGMPKGKRWVYKLNLFNTLLMTL